MLVELQQTTFGILGEVFCMETLFTSYDKEISLDPLITNHVPAWGHKYTLFKRVKEVYVKRVGRSNEKQKNQHHPTISL